MATDLHETDNKLEVSVGQTIKGYELVIVPTKSGLYRVEARGPGSTAHFEGEQYTTLLLAKRAVDNYRRANAAQYSKQEFIKRQSTALSHKEQRKLAREEAALALKNGKVEVTTDDDTE